MEVVGRSFVEEYNRLHPGCIEVYSSPRRGTIKRPVGGLASTSKVASYAAMQIAIGGAPFGIEDYPIVDSFSGLILGNTFNPTVQASYEYSKDKARFSTQEVLQPFLL